MNRVSLFEVGSEWIIRPNTPSSLTELHCLIVAYLVLFPLIVMSFTLFAVIDLVIIPVIYNQFSLGAYLEVLTFMLRMSIEFDDLTYREGCTRGLKVRLQDLNEQTWI